MRKLKFRLWNTFKQEWYKPIYKGDEGKIEDIYLSPRGNLYKRTYDGFYHESCFEDRFLKEQYTCLLDCNGQEIYEGDIIISDTNDLIEVIWDINCFTVPRMSHLYKIIGNIHENGDLLK